MSHIEATLDISSSCNLNNSNIDDDYLALLLSESGNEPVDVDAEARDIHLPHWYDADRFRRGQQLIRHHIGSMFAGMLTGLIAILFIPTILQVLICTKRSGTKKDAYRRYIETIYHTLAWTEYKLQPGSKAWKSIEMVRQKHNSARKSCERMQNITICQRDMAITQFAFFGFAILKPKMVGIHFLSEEDLRHIIHFWQVHGCLMGIKDEFNVCVASVEVTTKRLNGILQRIIRPSLNKTNEKCTMMTKAMIGGMQYFNSMVEYNAALYLTKRIAGCEGYQYKQNDFNYSQSTVDNNEREFNELSRIQKCKVRLYIFLTENVMRFDLGKRLANFIIRFDEFFSYYFPWTAIIDFGFVKAYVRIYNSKKYL